MQEIFEHLSEVFACGAFELCSGQSKNEYLIPYMMNDALEYYFVLKNCRLTGEYQKELSIESVQMDEEENRYVLIIRQENGNTFTLLFQAIEEKVQCYQYHNIGHFWVKGQEQWRQLVYIIGTICDKYEFFQERFCSEKEKELMPLVQFAPFRYWSPIHESLIERYPTDEKGLELMERLATEADDQEYVRLLKLYRRLPFAWMERVLSRKLNSPQRQNLYEKIWEKVTAASLEYPCRDYGERLNAAIENQRREVECMLLNQGFQGSYPQYYKENIGITVAEEHPFTILEWEDFVFRIRLMISESEDAKHRNAGFFQNKGTIMTVEEWKNAKNFC